MLHVDTTWKFREMIAFRRRRLLDGDNVRHGLNKDLGFTDEDRGDVLDTLCAAREALADRLVALLLAD